MTYRQIIEIITEDGWVQVRQKGSHRAFKRLKKKGIVTIAFHRMKDEVPKGTLNSILKQAQLK